MNKALWLDSSVPNDLLQPLRTWNDHDRERIRAMVTDCLRCWCEHWGVGSLRSDGCDVSVIEPGFEEEKPMRYTDADSGVTYRWSLEVPSFAVAQCIASGDYQNGIQAILELLYGDAVSEINAFSDLAYAVATDAWLDFIQRLQSLFGKNEKLEYPVASGSCLTWSGVLDLGWCWRGKDWTLRLSHSAIDMLLGTPFSQSRWTDVAVLDKPLTRLDDVVGSESIALRVELEPVRLTLGQLQRLDIGDTVILPHSLKLPLNVKTSQGEFVCEAWLGQAEHHTAIEFIEESVSQSKSQSARSIT